MDFQRRIEMKHYLAGILAVLVWCATSKASGLAAETISVHTQEVL
jgi:hypothetical protein